MQDKDLVGSEKKGTRRLRKGRVVALLAAFLCVLAGITYALFGSDDTRSADLNSPVKGIINVLVLGVDERGDDVGRSDTAFVVTIDTNKKAATVLSIPRDTRVKIPGHKWDKLNHAYAYGGTKLSQRAVEDLLGIPINYTVKVNFTSFVRLIDAIGGITIDVEKRMKYSDPYDDNGGLYIDIYPGVQRMNGKTAIQYVRYRDEEGDIGRVARQQKFMKAFLHEFTDPRLVTRLPDIIKECSSTLKTDMPTYEMVKLAPVISAAAKEGLHGEWVSGTPLWIDGVSYWQPDIRHLRQIVAQIQGITMDEKYRQTTERVAAEYARSVPADHETNEPGATADTAKPAATDKKPAAAPTKTATDAKNVTAKPKTDSAPTSGTAGAAATKESTASHPTATAPSTTDTTKTKTP